MKHRRRRRDSEPAVSSVLGAILVFGLLVVTLVTIQVKFVPVWDRDREAEHMQAVGNQFGQLKSDLDRMADNRTVVPISDPLTLEPAGGFRFFRGARLPGDLSLEPAAAGTGLRLSTNQARLLSENGQSLFVGSESWTAFVTGDTLNNVGQVQNLRLRISTPADWNTGDSVTMTVTNATGAYAGKLVVTNINRGVASGGPTYSFRFETFAASSTTIPVSIREVSFSKENPPPYQYFNLLDEDISLFKQVLAGAQAPATLTMTRFNMDASWTAAYTAVNPSGGSTQVGTSGTLVPDFNRRLLSGSLTMASNNQHFVEQSYTLEHGAVILSQPDGDVMFVAPSMSANVVAGIADVRWVLPAIQGSATTISGPTSASVTAQPGGSSSFVATMPCLHVELTTRHGAVWAQYWTTLFQEAGLSYGTEFKVASNETRASMTLFGLTDPGDLGDPDPDPCDGTSTVDDIAINFRGAQVHLIPRAGA